MEDSGLAIIDKQEFSFHGGTVAIHPICSHTSFNTAEMQFDQFSLLDDPNVNCIPKLFGGTRFEIHFSTEVSLTNEYEISVYYFQKPCKLIHVKTVQICQISQLSICKIEVPYLPNMPVNRISSSYLLLSKICRKDIPYVFPNKYSTLFRSQITDCSLLFENDSLTNFKIIVKDEEFRVYKEILAARSPVFLAMFSIEMREMQEKQMIIEDVDSDVFFEMLRYIYVNTVQNLETHAEKLLKTADKYDVPKLRLLCAGELSRSLEVENAIHLLELADQCHESTLKGRALKFIQCNIQEILQTENYKTWRQTAPGYLMADIMETMADFEKNYSAVTIVTY